LVRFHNQAKSLALPAETYYNCFMTLDEESEQRAIIDRINVALPSLVKNINEDSRLPWVHDLTRADLTVSRAPTTFVNGDAFESAARAVTKLISREDDESQRIRADLIGTRLVVFETKDESNVLMADFSFQSKREGILGFATLEFNDAGEITHVYRTKDYKDGELLSRKSGEYLQSLLTGLLLNSADDREPASGTSCVVIDGIRLYQHKQIFDADSGYMDAQVQLYPRTMPRIRNELSKEFKNYGARFPPIRNSEQAKNYYAEIGSQLENSEEMWWVSEDMSKLAWDVTMSGTEPEDLSDKELPAPAGIMWLNGGGGPVLMNKTLPDGDFLTTGNTQSELMSVNAIIWYTPTVGIPGVEIGQPRFMGLTASPGIVRDTAQWNGIVSPMDLESNEAEYHRVPTYVTYYNLKFLPRKMALVVMRLAREDTLGEKTSETVGGSPSKKKNRLRKIDTVTCASLRRHRYLSDAERESEARDYSHRWIVRGHMRNQPIGPRNTEGGQKHLRVWIAPYVKGPEDKPLVLKDRVQLFVSSARSQDKVG
jgi:hypothetical protein